MNTAILVAISLAVALVLIRLKVQNGLAMSIGALVMVITTGMGLTKLFQTAWVTLKSEQTLTIVGVMILVMMLEEMMSRFGLIDKLISSLSRLLPDKRIHMIILPAFMGLLPSAGGALLSCPMVEKASDGMEISAYKKAFSNFWFRHVMEFIAPVYTAIIMLSQLSMQPMGVILRTLLPVAAIATLVALPVAFAGTKKMPKNAADMEGTKRHAMKDLLTSISPLALILVMVIVFGLNPFFAIIPVILALAVIFRPKAADYKAILKKGFNLNIMFMVLGIMFYKEVLTASGGIDSLARTFTDMGLPQLAMVLALPFAIGFLTGMASPTIALSLPVLISMYGLSGITPQIAALTYVGCNFGMKLTPTHLCLVLTADYFKVDMIKLIGMMILPAALTILASALLLY